MCFIVVFAGLRSSFVVLVHLMSSSVHNTYIDRCNVQAHGDLLTPSAVSVNMIPYSHRLPAHPWWRSLFVTGRFNSCSGHIAWCTLKQHASRIYEVLVQLQQMQSILNSCLRVYLFAKKHEHMGYSALLCCLMYGLAVYTKCIVLIACPVTGSRGLSRPQAFGLWVGWICKDYLVTIYLSIYLRSVNQF